MNRTLVLLNEENIHNKDETSVTFISETCKTNRENKMSLLDKILDTKVVEAEADIHSFYWQTISNDVLIPYIIRKDNVKYISCRMGLDPLFKIYEKNVINDLFDKNSNTLECTESEAKLFNEINIEHMNECYGKEEFKANQSKIVKLEDFIKFYNFVKTNFKTLDEIIEIKRLQCIEEVQLKKVKQQQHQLNAQSNVFHNFQEPLVNNQPMQHHPNIHHHFNRNINLFKNQQPQQSHVINHQLQANHENYINHQMLQSHFQQQNQQFRQQLQIQQQLQLQHQEKMLKKQQKYQQMQQQIQQQQYQQQQQKQYMFQQYQQQQLNDQIIQNNFHQSFSVSPLQIPQSHHQSPSRHTQSPVFYSPISPALTPDIYNTRLSQFQTNKPIETDSISISDLNMLSLDFITPTSTPNLEQTSDTVTQIENIAEQIGSIAVDSKTNLESSLNKHIEILTETEQILPEVYLNIQSSDASEIVPIDQDKENQQDEISTEQIGPICDDLDILQEVYLNIESNDAASEIEPIDQNKENQQDEILPEKISPICDDVNIVHTTLEPITSNQIENCQIDKEKDTEVVPETVLAPIVEAIQLESQETSSKSKSTDLQSRNRNQIKRKEASKFKSDSKRIKIPTNDFLNDSDIFTKDESFNEDYYLKQFDIKSCTISLPIGNIPPMTQKKDL